MDLATYVFVSGFILLALGNLSSAVLLAVLHRLTRRPFLYAWTVSWGLLFLHHLAAGLSASAMIYWNLPPDGWERLVLSTLSLAGGFGHALFTVVGALALGRGAMPSRSRIQLWVVASIFAAVVITSSTSSWNVEWRLFGRAGLRSLAAAGALIFAAWVGFKRIRERPRPGSKLCFVAFGLHGVEQLLFVFMLFPPFESFGAVGSSASLVLPYVDVGLQVLIAFGMVVSLFDEEREAAAAARDALLRTEESLQQAHKMEAVGRLAGGIAHDFNNALTGIMGYTELIGSEVAGNATASEYLEGVRVSAVRAKSMVQRLLSFSRKQVVQNRVLDVNAVCREFAEMVRRIIGEDVQLVLEFDPDCGRVAADPNQIHQALMNLAVNARDAMPHGGRLSIATMNYDAPEDESHSGCRLEKGRYVVLLISDSGCGMDQATRRRIFEPFFTTKRDGTGLGLAMVYSIVRQAHGAISVDSVVGRGTSFKIYLRRSFEAVAPARSLPASGGPPGGVERLLIVEDDAAIRDVMCRSLGALGYQVTVAESGEAALALIEERGPSYDLLISDMVLGGMSGAELARRLWSQTAKLKVLFISGYAGSLGQETIGGPASFMQKPFEPQTLAVRIREMLDQPLRGASKHIEVVQRNP